MYYNISKKLYNKLWPGQVIGTFITSHIYYSSVWEIFIIPAKYALSSSSPMSFTGSDSLYLYGHVDVLICWKGPKDI